MIRTTAIILAAGFSRRFGEDKLLTPIHGVPMIRRIANTVLHCGFSQTLVVCRDDRLKTYLPDGVKSVLNEQPNEGLGSSIRAGVNHADPSNLFMFFMGDQPFVSDTVIRTLLAAWNKGESWSIVVPLYGEQRGTPVIFSASWKTELSRLSGEAGGRSIMEKHPDKIRFVTIDDHRAGLDVDTRDDLREVTKNDL